MISRILVANRGEIARRIFRTCRDMGISTVAVYSEADADAPHVGDADEAVALPGSTPSESYLNIPAILDAAKQSGADAIHPGYGFLSENAAFATAVIESGLTWIGPAPETIEIMGSKIESKRLVELSGVPTLPSVEISEGTDIDAEAAAIGFPVLVKASAGGGGKGMKVVSSPDDLAAAVESAAREAQGAFGDGTLFLEKYLTRPRHIEVQVFGDHHGNVVSMFERECSIQRRHQKIVEESPSPVIDADARPRLEAAAIDAARAVNYVGAGTVEFLYRDGDFYFLEMNTRLQVEHPVTEMVTGLDLVRLQIEVADGGTVHAPTEVNGHAIEARLYAEDPLNDFLPATGTVDHIEFDDLKGLRVDSGVEDGSTISIHYDPMIAKVIAHAPTREDAARLLARALREARIHGVTTNRDLLVHILEHPEFLDGATDTGFLERNPISELGRSLLGAEDEVIAAIGAALADQAEARRESSVLSTLPSGWRNSADQMQTRHYRGVHGDHTVRYRIGRDGVHVDGLEDSRVVGITPGSVVIHSGATELRLAVSRYGEVRHVDSELGPARLVEIARFNSAATEEETGSLHAPMPGVIVRVEVSPGDSVREGQVLVVLEAMKMEHSLKAPGAGTVSEVRHTVGEQVETGTVLVVVEES